MIYNKKRHYTTAFSRNIFALCDFIAALCENNSKKTVFFGEKKSFFALKKPFFKIILR